MKHPIAHRLLTAYSVTVTAGLAVLLFSGFDAGAKPAKFKEITVERINVVEPDGTLRLVIANKARTPGIYMKGREYLPGVRNTAGMIFLNDEGSESGGLTFHGSKDAEGVERALGHLSFDGYMQDQLMTLDATQTGDRRGATININDQPYWDVTEYLELLERILDLPPEEQQAELDKFWETHPRGQNRIVFGRGGDQSVALAMKDPEGRPRLILQVGPDGNPILQLKNADGDVIAQLPE